MPAIPLTTGALRVWAKSSVATNGWLPLHQHLLDAADVVTLLFDTWLAPAVKQQWANHLSGGDADVQIMLTFLAGVHDIGKATPAFAVQVETLCAPMRACGLECGTFLDYPERRLLPHALAGHVVLNHWLRQTAGLDPT